MKTNINQSIQGQSLLPRVLVAAAHLPATPVTVQDATIEFRARMDVQEYGRKVFVTMRIFSSILPPTPLISVVAGMIHDYLFAVGTFKDTHRTWQSSTMANVLGRFRSFFRWALPHYGFHAAPNPAHAVRLQTHVPLPFVPLTLVESQRLLDSYWECQDGIYTPSLLLSARCAARSSEARLFQLKDLNVARGEVMLGDHSRRVVELVGSTALIFRRLSERGLLRDRSFNPSRRTIETIIQKAGLAPGRVQYSILRRTALCYYFAQCHDLSRTAAWGGLSVHMFRKPLQIPVHHASVGPFWDMMPTKCQ